MQKKVDEINTIKPGKVIKFLKCILPNGDPIPPENDYEESSNIKEKIITDTIDNVIAENSTSLSKHLWFSNDLYSVRKKFIKSYILSKGYIIYKTIYDCESEYIHIFFYSSLSSFFTEKELDKFVDIINMIESIIYRLKMFKEDKNNSYTTLNISTCLLKQFDQALDEYTKCRGYSYYTKEINEEQSSIFITESQDKISNSNFITDYTCLEVLPIFKSVSDEKQCILHLGNSHILEVARGLLYLESKFLFKASFKNLRDSLFITISIQ